MSRLIVTVPIQLARDDDGFWLQVASPTNREASLNLSETGGPLVQGILLEWAKHVFAQAAMKNRRSTGVLDNFRKVIYEGDLIRIRHSDPYPSAVGVVSWNGTLGAFILQGDTERHGPWSTPNLGGANNGVIIGNLFENRELMVPAAYSKLPDED